MSYSAAQCWTLQLAGQIICEGHVAVHGVGAAAAFQLHQPAVFGDKGDGVRASEGVLHQTPALPGTAGSHAHCGKPGAVPPNVSPRAIRGADKIPDEVRR